MPERRYTYGGDLQIRQDAGSPSPGTITGPVIVYGDVAPNPFGGLGSERMRAGAWGSDVERQDWTANLMHQRAKIVGRTGGGGLTLRDSSSALSATLVLPDSEAGRETALLARTGVLRGLSGEFDILAQEHGADGVRDVLRASGDALGVVDRPAYSQSQLQIRFAEFPEAQIRQVDDRDEITGEIPYNQIGVISMARGERHIIRPGAFNNLAGGEIILLAGASYDRPLASTVAGSLTLTDSPTALRFTARGLPDTGYAADFLRQMDKGLVRGLSVGWADGGDVVTLPDGMFAGATEVNDVSLCEIRGLTRSTFEDSSLAYRRRLRNRRWVY